MSNEESRWQSHRGGTCPVPPETKLHVRYRNGQISEKIQASQRRWEMWRDLGETDWDIVAWRAEEPSN